MSSQIKMFAILAAITLAGCTPAPIIKTVTQTVEVPVAVACKTPAPPAPDYCFSKLTDTDDIFTDTKCLLSDRELHKAYENSLRTALDSCK